MYRPLSDMLQEVYRRYGRPLAITETGTEGQSRQPWLSLVSDHVFQARGAGVPVHGLCLYPILDYPGWANDRHCETGLFGYVSASAPGQESLAALRPLFRPLADELALQRRRFEEPSAARTVELGCT
jgi:hypothetical protein